MKYSDLFESSSDPVISLINRTRDRVHNMKDRTGDNAIKIATFNRAVELYERVKGTDKEAKALQRLKTAAAAI